MALTSRHVFRDADYRVGVIPVNDSQGVACDLQGVVLYDSNGNAISSFTCDTELPAPAVLADGDAIPTTPTIGAVMRGVNASGTVDNAKLAKAHNLNTSGTEYAVGISKRIAAAGGSIAETYGAGAVAAGTQRITLASDDPAVVALGTISGNVDQVEGSLTTLNAKDFATQTTLSALNAKVTTCDTGAVALSQTITDNAGFTDGTSKVLAAGFVFDETAGTALTENDAAAARIDSKRAQVLVIEDGTTRGNRAAVEAAGSFSVPVLAANKGLTINARAHQLWSSEHPDVAGDNNFYAQNQDDNGNLCSSISAIRGKLLRYRNATGTISSGTNPPPLWVGGAAATVTPSSVTAGRAVDGYWSKSGHLVVNLDSVREQDGDQLTTLTSTTTVTTIVTADATYMNDLTGLILTNTSATATDFILYNDDGTTERAHIYIPAGDTRGVVFGKPFKQTAINKAWKGKTVTSVASVYVTAQFSKQL